MLWLLSCEDKIKEQKLPYIEVKWISYMEGAYCTPTGMDGSTMFDDWFLHIFGENGSVNLPNHYIKWKILLSN